ncbi:MAG: cobalt transporter CbiM [Anaerolineaceae bacterium]|nr:cobalt transporter CbiM [Anaerolineaceae bacterium]
MHIADGILSGPVLLGGAALAAGGVTLGLRKLDYERVPQVAVLSSVFFVASLIHAPVGPASMHLVLNGLTGLILGWAAFPAILVALFLQAILFGHGGLTVLGVNTLNMALPAVACYYLFRRSARRAKSAAGAFGCGAAAGGVAIALGALMTALALLASGEEFKGPAIGMAGAYLPLVFIEGLLTGSIVVFLRRVRPELLDTPLAGQMIEEVADA